MEALKPFFDTLVGKRIAGRYLVERLLGSGGMGLVAAARYPELGQKVAIKFLRPELAVDTVVTTRFMREARVAAKVKSVHFVRVFDVGRLESGVPYLVMEMLSGRDVGDELRERGPLPVADAVDWILQACAGLAELHALGIVHRDLKPSNLFIANVAGTNIVKVLDFGISKEQKTDSLAPLTATDHVLGTPQYMSPEQVKASRDVDLRSDIWSLGVILYELVTQSIPFPSEGGGVGEMFAKILYVDPEKPSARRKDLPEGFEALILKCMSREKDARFASVPELAEALRPFATESSRHRVDAVKLAASAPPPEIDDDPILEVAERDAGDHSSALTKESSPNAKREAIAFAPTESSSKLTAANAVASVKPSQAAQSQETAMTSSSIVTGPKKEAKAAKSNKTLIAVVLGLVAVGAVLGIAFSRGDATNTTTTTGAPSASVEPNAVATAPSATATAATATQAVIAPPTASAIKEAEGVTSPSPSPSPSPAPVPAESAASATAPTAPRPRPSGVAGVRAPTRTLTAPRGSSAPALILDRK